MAKAKEWKDSDITSKQTTCSRDKHKTQKQKCNDDDMTESSDEDGMPQARRYHGWSAQGIMWYNQLFDDIQNSCFWI
jgi:TnpA family transposase